SFYLWFERMTLVILIQHLKKFSGIFVAGTHAFRGRDFTVLCGDVEQSSIWFSPDESDQLLFGKFRWTKVPPVFHQGAAVIQSVPRRDNVTCYLRGSISCDCLLTLECLPGSHWLSAE